MATVIGGNTRMVSKKDMEHGRLLVETDTSGKSVMMRNTGMEYSDGLMEEYITESTKRIREMEQDIKGGQMEKNIGDSTRMTCNGEKESHKRMEYFTKTNMKKTSASKGVNYIE